MGERSGAPGKTFPRGRLLVGLVLVGVLAAAVAFGLSRLRRGPDLGRLVYATEDGVFVRELASGAQRRLADLPSDTLDAWPDTHGRWLAYARRRGDLWLLDLESQRRWRVSERLSTGLGWTPDDRLVAAELLSDRDLVAVDPEDRGTDLLVSGFRGGRIMWIDDGRFLTTIGGDAVVVGVSSDRPTVRKLVDDAWPLAVSPDSSELLYVVGPEGSTPRVAIAELDGERLGPTRTVFAGLAARAAVSAQGFVAFSGRDRSNAGGTWVLEARSRPPRRVSRGQAEAIAWSLDGSSLVTLIDGSVSAHDLREGRTVRLSPRGAYVRAFAVVP